MSLLFPYIDVAYSTSSPKMRKEAIELVRTCWDVLAPFPGLPTVQFMLTCSMQNRKVKTWCILSHEWHQCLPIKRKNKLEANLRPYHVVSALSAVVLNVHEVKNIPLRVQNKEKCEQKAILPMGGPPSVYQGRHWCHSCDKMDLVFSFISASDQKLDSGKT